MRGSTEVARPRLEFAAWMDVVKWTTPVWYTPTCCALKVAPSSRRSFHSPRNGTSSPLSGSAYARAGLNGPRRPSHKLGMQTVSHLWFLKIPRLLNNDLNISLLVYRNHIYQCGFSDGRWVATFWKTPSRRYCIYKAVCVFLCAFSELTWNSKFWHRRGMYIALQRLRVLEMMTDHQGLDFQETVRLVHRALS